MKQAKLLGYKHTKYHMPADSYNDHDHGHDGYTIYCEIDGDLYEFNVMESYGSCYSGYTSASWGIISNLDEADELPEDMVKITKELIIKVFFDDDSYFPYLTITESGHTFDPVVETLKTIDGQEIAMSTGDGGCQYYSSGTATINLEAFY